MREEHISQQQIRRLNLQLKEQRQNEERLDELERQREQYAQKRAKQQKQEERERKEQHKHERFIRQRARRIYEQRQQHSAQRLEAQEARTLQNIQATQEHVEATIRTEKARQQERAQRARDFKRALLEQDFEARNYIFNQAKKDVYNYIKGQVNVMLRAEEQRRTHDARIREILQNKSVREAQIRENKLRKLQEKEARLIEVFAQSPPRLERINADRCIRSAGYLRKSLHGAYEPLKPDGLDEIS